MSPKFKVHVARYGDGPFVAEITDEDMVGAELTGDCRTPTEAARAAARKLRGLANRFDRLADNPPKSWAAWKKRP